MASQKMLKGESEEERAKEGKNKMIKFEDSSDLSNEQLRYNLSRKDLEGQHL